MKLIRVQVSNKHGGVKSIILDTAEIADVHAAHHGTALCGHLSSRIDATRIVLKDGTRFKTPVSLEVFNAEVAKAGQHRIAVRTVEMAPLPWKPGYEPEPTPEPVSEPEPTE